MEKKILSLIIALLSCSFSAHADEIWNTGHHEITDGDIYNEIWMYNDSSAIMLGGDVFKLETFNISSFDMRDGEMDILTTHNDSMISIYGGDIGSLHAFDDTTINIFSSNLIGLGAVENSTINLFAYDVVHHPTGGSTFNGWVEGRYFSNDLYFSFDLIQDNSFSHINVIPEPTSFMLIGLGSILFMRSNGRECIAHRNSGGPFLSCENQDLTAKILYIYS